jgi:coproporphyrinogen III oxidase-like Fe-S oxidoreductase
MLNANNIERGEKMTLDEKQINALNVVNRLSGGLLTTPVMFSKICDKLNFENNNEVASVLQYLEEKNYLRHNGRAYYLTASGFDFIKSL